MLGRNQTLTHRHTHTHTDTDTQTDRQADRHTDRPSLMFPLMAQHGPSDGVRILIKYTYVFFFIGGRGL